MTYASLPVELRRREYALLAHMASDPERVWTRHELLRDVWGYRAPGKTRTVDSHAARQAGSGRRRRVGRHGVGRRLPARAVASSSGRGHPSAKGRAMDHGCSELPSMAVAYSGPCWR